MAEIATSNLDGWFLPSGAVHVCRLIENIRCGVILYDDTGQPSERGFWAPDVELPVCYHHHKKSPFPIRDYLPLLEATHPEMFNGVPLDGTKATLEFPIEWNMGELSIATTSGRKWAYLTKLIADVSYQATVCEIHEGVHHEYRHTTNEMIQHTSFETKFLGLPVTFEHQSGHGDSQIVRRKFRHDRAKKE